MWRRSRRFVTTTRRCRRISTRRATAAMPSSAASGERRVIEAHRSIRTRPVHTFMVEGDRAVINWVFEFVDHEGRAYTLDELAFQLWRGERIVEERFYYDPAQRARRTAPG
jgi:ketosteroid isomerase-like protein